MSAGPADARDEHVARRLGALGGVAEGGDEPALDGLEARLELAVVDLGEAVFEGFETRALIFSSAS